MQTQYSCTRRADALKLSDRIIRAEVNSVQALIFITDVFLQHIIKAVFSLLWLHDGSALHHLIVIVKSQRVRACFLNSGKVFNGDPGQFTLNQLSPSCQVQCCSLCLCAIIMRFIFISLLVNLQHAAPQLRHLSFLNKQ